MTSKFKPSGQVQTVLVVEDDADIREIMKLILFDQGFRILEAASEAEAMTMWNKNPYQVDLLIADVCIPYRSTGMELGRKLRAHKPDLKIIYTSGFGIDLLETDFAFCQEFYFLPKPFKPEQLLQMVTLCLDGLAEGRPDVSHIIPS